MDKYLEGLEILGLAVEDLKVRERVEPIAMRIASQIARVLPNDIAVEALFTASTGRKSVVAGAAEHLVSEGFSEHSAGRLAEAAFGPRGINTFDAHPVLWLWFQRSIGQSPVVPALPWILKNHLPSGIMPMPGERPPEGSEVQ